MNLTEHQGKGILRDAGIPVPAGEIATSIEDAVAIAERIGSPPWVVKAQIPAGGRAHGHFKGDSQAKGGVRFARSSDEIRSNTRQMLDHVLVTQQTGSAGSLVESVYVEEHCPVREELYLALTIDRESGGAAFIASRRGGSGIETQAEQLPESILRAPIDLDDDQMPGAIADALSDTPEQRDDMLHLMKTIRDVFVARDALLIEINPLGLDPNGRFVALDATVVIDDNARFRQGDLLQADTSDALPTGEIEAARHGLNYVKLRGNIGTLSVGAGMAMATLDAVHERGGQPANFLDIPPSATVPRIQTALEILLTDPDVDGVFINVFGGGIMRCDAIADALLLARESLGPDIPVVVRLAGTNAALANQRLSASMPAAVQARDLADGATRIVELVQGRDADRTSQAVRERSWWQRVQSMLGKASV